MVMFLDNVKSRLFSGTLFGFFQNLMMAFAILIPTIYFASLEISIVVYAFLLSIGDVFSFFMKPAVGHLADKHGERKYLLVGGLVFFLSLFLIGQTTSILWIAVAKIVGGIASALVFVLIIIYSLRLVKKKPDGKIGFFGGISNIGWIVGLLIPGLFIDRFGIQPSFYMIFVAGIIWVTLMFKYAKKKSEDVKPPKPSFSFVRKIPKFIIFKSMDLAMFSAFLFFFTRYALQTLGLSISTVSFIVVTEVIFFALSNLAVGKISNRRVRKYWVPLCIAFHLLAATTMVYASLLIHYYFVGIFIGIAGGFIDIWIYSNISEKFEHYEKGKVIGTLGWSYDIATIAGAQVPLIFILLGFGTFTALYVFPIIMLITLIACRKT